MNNISCPCSSFAHPVERAGSRVCAEVRWSSKSHTQQFCLKILSNSSTIALTRLPKVSFAGCFKHEFDDVLVCICCVSSSAIPSIKTQKLWSGMLERHLVSYPFPKDLNKHPCLEAIHESGHQNSSPDINPY